MIWSLYFVMCFLWSACMFMCTCVYIVLCFMCYCSTNPAITWPCPAQEIWVISCCACLACTVICLGRNTCWTLNKISVDVFCGVEPSLAHRLWLCEQFCLPSLSALKFFHNSFRFFVIGHLFSPTCFDCFCFVSRVDFGSCGKDAEVESDVSR